MQEVASFVHGERNYENMAGDTGPLVYPAGFVYIFSALRWLTNEGENIFAGQCIFVALYLVTLNIVLRLYRKAAVVPWWACIFLILSKRIHSIFMLRLFNDCIAVLFGYLAIDLFTSKRWRIGCVVYSLSIGIKMNMLLHAPGILLVLLVCTGIKETVVCLSICATVQFLLGCPFLVAHPMEYIKRSFDFGRVFMYKWTVNWKFLPEEVFLSKAVSITLLVLTVCFLLFFAYKWFSTKKLQITFLSRDCAKMDPCFIITTIFTSNFIGIVFARTLHYQFYVWYFHMLPHLLWCIRIPTYGRVLIMLMIEVAFNVYPATAWSSLLLQAAHIFILLSIFRSNMPEMDSHRKEL
jgi:alpha-1,3-mannosyltransferase